MVAVLLFMTFDSRNIFALTMREMIATLVTSMVNVVSSFPLPLSSPSRGTCTVVGY